MRLVFEKQVEHLVALIVLLAAALWVAQGQGFRSGGFSGLDTPGWLHLSLAVPVLHQLFVWIVWRLELHFSLITRWFGRAGFPVYGVIFGLLFLSRPVTLVGLAIANRSSLQVDHRLLWLLALILLIPVLYVLYSVVRYFGIRRALGIDHFDSAYRTKPLVKEGAFKLVGNAMYVLGLLFLWLPGLIWGSKSALLAALFGHLYIWAHYLFVEKPDMAHIYGD